MIRNLSVQIALIFLIGSLSACATKRGVENSADGRFETVRQAVEPAAPPPLLWEVRGEHGSVYLFGTMHFGVPRSELSRKVDEAFARCKMLVLESDPNSADPRKLADMMMLTGGPGIDEQLGEERWARLMELLGGTFEERVAKRLQPWVLEAALIQEILPPGEMMELTLAQEAKNRRMTVEYLESWEEQVAVLNKVGSTEPLAEIIDDPEGFRARMDTMTDDYARGDLQALQFHIETTEYDALFETRNRTWLERIDELSRRGDVFIAVGAGHLLGENSVLELLEDDGYEVRRVE